MCGIIGHISRKKGVSGEAVIMQFEDQKERGTNGFGLMLIDKKSVKVHRATEPIKALLDIRLNDAPIMVFHHRIPTSTENTILQTHPLHVSHDELKFDYMIVHNGVIRNSHELHTIHEDELGYVYKTDVIEVTKSYYGYGGGSSSLKFNDSESLAIEVARYLEGLTSEIGAIGSAAFIAVQIDKKTKAPKKIIWGRNSGNPLEMLESKDGLLLASSILSSEAVSTPVDSFICLDIAKVLSSKTNDILSLATSGELKFATPPLPVTTPYRGTQSFLPTTATRAVADDAISRIPFSDKSAPSEEDDIDPDKYLTKREKAFAVMGERVGDDIQEYIQSLFDEMAWRDIPEAEITQVCSCISDILTEKTKLAKEKVRPYFDRKECEEAGLEFGDEPDTVEDREMEEIIHE